MLPKLTLTPALLTLTLLLVSCSPRIIEHRVSQVDTTYIDRLRVDSLYQRDSIYIRVTPDTVYQYVERWRDRYIYRRDTIDRIVRDTTIVERIETVETRKPLSWWQRLRVWAFWPLVGFALFGWRREIVSLVKRVVA